jgi:ubiquinone/menaquinone biosynthesis C-methylase UbiE
MPEPIHVNNDRSNRKTEVRMQFNAAASDYDAGPGAFAHFGKRLVDVAAITPGNRVLDVASGRGAVLFPAAEKAGASGDAVGVDFAEEMVRATIQDVARLGLRVRVLLMDAEHLDFPDAAFDRVLCGFGIMFFPNQERALEEFRRVLRPGGRLAVSTWHTHQVKEVDLAMTAAGLMPPRSPGWIKEPDQLARLLTATGFSNVHVNMDTHSFRYVNIDDYWGQARGTGLRRTLDSLDSAQTERVRSALVERMRQHQRPDGFYVAATALLAVANR